MHVIKLKYGNTNTYFISGLLIDTDMAGTGSAFRRELKKQGIMPDEIRYVLATHYHPDHMGLIGELMRNGVKLLLLTHQKAYIHFSDEIYARTPGSGFVPVDGERATVISAGESRAFLASLGIAGEILPTKSHSPDGAALLLDDGNAFVGDLEPLEYLDGYTENAPLAGDWNTLIESGADVIHYAHIPDMNIPDMNFPDSSM